ncbi:MAG: glutathione S-transferase family protein [Alphaproteobacteria bacterium]
MLKILGRSNSINVQKVLWCCDELNLPYEREDFGGAFGKNQSPEYLRLNPNGLVPTLIDGDFVLWESNAIVRYLSAKYGAGTLWPTDPRERAMGDKWMDWQISTLFAYLRPVFWTLIRTKPEDRDMKALAVNRDKLAQLYAMMDDALGRTPYLSGERFSMADIPAGLTTFRWYVLDIEREDFKNLKAWYDRIAARPAFKKHSTLPLT